MAEWTGLEPATSGVTGQHSNRLNYHSAEPVDDTDRANHPQQITGGLGTERDAMPGQFETGGC